MKSNIFVPKRINVGFQERSDTYTKKLAYVIYYDNKGVLRKEASWSSWRDEKIEPIEYQNVPTSGFVLNKKVGDYVSDWNHRQAYVRVYDPRDFEFEITIENLLYILENTSSIKGKGLEGDFVYGWDGKDLILMPTDSPDYVEIAQYNEIIHSNNFVKAKDLVIGATYKTKQNEEWIYMGRFDCWDTEYKSIAVNYRTNYMIGNQYQDSVYTNVNKGKQYFFFYKQKSKWSDETYEYYKSTKTLGDKLIDVVSEECVSNYAELFEKLETNTMYSPYDETKDKYVSYLIDEFIDKYDLSKKDWGWDFNILTGDKTKKSIRYDRNNTKAYYEENYNGYRTDRTNIGTIEDVYNKYHPIYKNKYLENNKFYGREY